MLSAAGCETNPTSAGCFDWHNQTTLQQAVDAHKCVEIAPGTYDLARPLTMPIDRTIQAITPGASVLRANRSLWHFTGLEALVQSSNTNGNVHINNLTLDANKVATYAVGYKGVTVHGSNLKNARCNDVGIVGQNVTIEYSTITGGGTNCPSSPPGAAIYVEGRTLSNHSLAPHINHNVITKNFGPALDINGADRGEFTQNIVSDNRGWSAVSVYGGSYWNISGNVISEPATRVVNPYQRYCNQPMPAGPGSAGIFLCQNTDSGGLSTLHNVVEYNRVSGYYGIISIGADEIHKYLVPRDNTFMSNSTSGSHVGCADDFKPGQWPGVSDKWAGNLCGTIYNQPNLF
jgi:hypothetical protein